MFPFDEIIIMVITIVNSNEISEQRNIWFMSEKQFYAILRIYVFR